ncbi:MAG: dipeptide ABC transporter ATP-binding protein [Eubacteriales bacterium]|nr:dipeptide ABC transporter ATP-binding protein [Eubacteriales bacterium]MDD3073625.1 dipeptide ABC transporter ATP-binding protein [Eubacteriales bacterium]MDD4079541.1 dipeptide ABC transporter ATP-binding protein [Eubacteriales bacterium]MDD4769813.1 dipeptide ABC transporter ATP-binding protein [Eubacteriales bacterium]
MLESARPLLQVQDLVKYYPVKHGSFSRAKVFAKAVDGISFDIAWGETLGLVGESGCGKTTAAMTILRLEEASSGIVIFDGRNLMELDRSELRQVRREMQVVFQDPYSSLNPRMTVRDIVAEPLIVHKEARGNGLERKVAELLDVVGLSPSFGGRYPHEFSGGQRQRIGLARALALNPKLIILDEPVSALDVSIQSQIVNLLEDLQQQFKLTYLFIAHDLSVVNHISDRVAVMYLGKIAEMADTEELFCDPQHPYTQALLSSVPIPDPAIQRKKIILKGNVPSPVNPPWGCRFHTRCPYKMDICTQKEPLLNDIGGSHFVACHLTGGQVKK